MIDFTGIIEKLNALAKLCKQSHYAAEVAGWDENSTAEWQRVTVAYRATKQAVELIGYSVDRIDNGDGTYTHEIERDGK